jgi:DNA-nicking Smr family endonuclease
MKKRGNSCDKISLEPPAPSPADQELFRSSLIDVTPITPHGRVVTPAARPPPIPLCRLRDEREVMFESLHDPIRWDEGTENGDELSFIRSGISRQILRRLLRGDWTTQAELDLHGLIRLEAKIELVNFLFECGRRGFRCIRIIHGKGLGSKNREPVLKLHVRHWLMQRDEVLAFVQARPVDGGGGAVMVLLKSGARS